MATVPHSPLLRPLFNYESQAMAAAKAIDRRRDEIDAHVERVPPGRFERLIKRVRLGAECVADVTRGRYKHIPWATVGSLVLALGYFLAPLDAIPDFIPFTGFIDDAAVLGVVYLAAEADLRRYCEWRGLVSGDYFD